MTLQLTERIRSGLGRSYVIRRNGCIVAHIATFAEAEGAAVISGAVVKREYKKEDFYDKLSGFLSWELDKEGKIIFSFATHNKMVRWLSYCHMECAKYGKLVKKNML